MRKTSVMGLAVCCLMLAFAGGADAQLVKQINFSKAEGYVDGLLVGQPTSGDKWTAASVAQGENCFNVLNEAMYVHPDGTGVIWVYINIPVQTKAPVTATWDWQYFGAPENKMDLGFTVSDSNNYNNDGDPNTIFAEQCTPTRMGDLIDARKGDWNGGGNWISDNGVVYRDGVLVHMRMVIDPREGEWSFDVFAQREGEAEVQVADDFEFRLAPTAETNGVNDISLWLNGGNPETSVILDNIKIVGPDPIVDVNHWDLY